MTHSVGPAVVHLGRPGRLGTLVSLTEPEATGGPEKQVGGSLPENFAGGDM